MKTKPLTFLLALTFLFLFSGSSTSSSLVSLVSTEKADPPIPVIGSHFYVGTRDLVNDKFVWRESDFVPLIPKKHLLRMGYSTGYRNGISSGKRSIYFAIKTENMG